MKTTEVLRSERYLYTLERDDAGGLYLMVVCGGVAWYVVTIALDAEERHRYESEGQPFLDELAQEVYAHPSRFQHRRVELS